MIELKKVVSLSASALLITAGLATVSAEPAAAGATCATNRNFVPVRVAPKTGAPVKSFITAKGTKISCSSAAAGWWSVSFDGSWQGYVGKRFTTSDAG